MHGNWSFTPDTTLSGGRHNLITMDANGQCSGAFSLTVDTNGPAPVITYAQYDIGDQQTLSSGSITDDTKPIFWGTAQANTIVTF